MPIEIARSQLLVIDVQTRLMPAIRGADALVSRVSMLANIARRLQVPVVASEHYPEGLGHSLPELLPLADKVVRKIGFDATTAPGFFLPSESTAILTGCETHVCVLQTALGLQRAGLRVVLVVDAVGSRRAIDYDTALRRLERRGIELLTAEMVAFEWLRAGDHPAFRDCLRWIK